MLLSAVSVLVVAQSSSEIPEVIKNNPVYHLGERYGSHSVSPVGIISPLSHIQLPPIGRTSERSLANFILV